MRLSMSSDDLKLAASSSQFAENAACRLICSTCNSPGQPSISTQRNGVIQEENLKLAQATMTKMFAAAEALLAAARANQFAFGNG